MNIYEIGDRLPIGNFSLHSKFNKYHNFINEYGELATVTTEKSGPNTITVSENLLKYSDFLVVTDKNLQINFNRYQKNSIQTYNSGLYIDVLKDECEDINDCWFKTMIELKKIYNYLKIKDENRTLLSIINFEKLISLKKSTHIQKNLTENINNKDNNLFSVEKKYKFSELVYKEIEDGIELFLNKQFDLAIPKIKGHGFGLTPSGDDWLAGALTGVSFYEQFFQKKFKTMKESIFALSKGKNLISNSFIYFAKESSFFYDVKIFLTSLLKKDYDSLSILGVNVLEHGATSGGDFLSGFFAVLLKKEFFSN